MSSQRLVVIGNGMAPGRVLDHLFEREPGKYDVTIFNAEPRVNYDRIMLSPVLSGEKAFEDIIIHDDNWYKEHQVTLHCGKRVSSVDRAAKTVTADDGTTASYDKLLIALASSFRTDLFRKAAEAENVRYPLVDSVVEGAHGEPWPLDESSTPIAMPHDRMMDRVSFDPQAMDDYVDSFPINGLRKRGLPSSQ